MRTKRGEILAERRKKIVASGIKLESLDEINDEPKKEKLMTPLYSKDIQRAYIDAANIGEEIQACASNQYGEVRAINRLVSNGNEVMEVLGKAEAQLAYLGATGTSHQIRGLIRIIKRGNL